MPGQVRRNAHARRRQTSTSRGKHRPRQKLPKAVGHRPRRRLGRIPPAVRQSLLAVGFTLLLSVLSLCMLMLTVSAGMADVTKDRILSADAVPLAHEYDCILVLGAGVRDDGTPSDMLYDRVITACAVYEQLDGAGATTPLLMSGDHTGDYNEVGVMKATAMEAGILGEHIFLDHAGYSTFESLWRAREVFGARRVVIVSQGYHLPRALFIARELGLEAVGVAADRRSYRGQTRYDLREIPARCKDMFASLRHRNDVWTGARVDLDGDGNLT